MKLKKIKMFLIAIAILGLSTGTLLINGAPGDHIVAFDPDDGSAYPDWFKTEVADGELITDIPADPVNPVNPEYEFLGWAHSYDDDGNPIFWDFAEDRVYENITLWAEYETFHLVAFDPDNGTVYPDWFKIEVVNGGLVTEQPAAPIKPGYQFIGWAHSYDIDGNPILWDFAEDRVYNNTTLWAEYATLHLVTFDPQDGSTYPDWYKTEVADGELITSQPANPSKPGYQFIGWAYAYNEDDTPIFWNFSEERVYDNTMLWAEYAELYTVTFDPDDGSLYPDWFKTQVVSGGLVIDKPADPQKTGYAFDGWYQALDEDGNPIFWDFSTDRVYNNMMLWASYTELYKVTFDPQNGTSSSAWTVLDIRKNSTITQTPPLPVREGYKFMGWSKDARTLVAWNFSNDIVAQDVTLYAIWEKEATVTPVVPPTNPGKLPGTGQSSDIYMLAFLVMGAGALLVLNSKLRKRNH